MLVTVVNVDREYPVIFKEGINMIKDLCKNIHVTPTGAKSIAFDCINDISDLYGGEPEIANAMIRGVRYYLGYLQQAGVFDEVIPDKNFDFKSTEVN